MNKAAQDAEVSREQKREQLLMAKKRVLRTAYKYI
jgi:hypothetical protein